MIKLLKQKYADLLSKHRSNRYKKDLTNYEPIIVANDCTGGFIYKHLGLQYRTPFMWLNLSSEDFLTVLEDFDFYMNSEMIQDTEVSKKEGFPVGVWPNGVRVYFRHYKTWERAINKWTERSTRMDRIKKDDGSYHYNTEHIGFMLTEGVTDRKEYERFSKLPYKHKVALTPDKNNTDIPSAVWLKDWPEKEGTCDVLNKMTGKRYIDQWDWIGFINDLKN